MFYLSKQVSNPYCPFIYLVPPLYNPKLLHQKNSSFILLFLFFIVYSADSSNMKPSTGNSTVYSANIDHEDNM